ncbi:hypothetical protein Pst134EA_013378 [Puccinia striiformis f. sp. tritici]|uniref:hypothetical protein n=2 Tax=Puccinia striiformis f. sp. tritici TaxID=168172 RepID=UPI002008B257|nr:hypothetical protein Pst134EA_013378 [Puccinia striiformis f. sp. tritici]KAH9465497.1 hypothetical protein Pst134EA_013378 [Puccinia striiformis f. sp. tritici]
MGSVDHVEQRHCQSEADEMENKQDIIGFDQLGWILSILILLSYLIPSIINPEQPWLIHPVILAHQATFSQTRKQSESPTITNSGATPNTLPVTPDRSIKSLYDLLLKAEGKLQQVDVHSIVPQDVSFKTLISNVRNHLWSLLGKTRTDENQNHLRMLILCKDPYFKLVLSLAAATLPMVTIVGTLKGTGTFPIEARSALEPHLDHLSLVISELPNDILKELLGSKLTDSCQVRSGADISGWFQDNGSNSLLAPDKPSELSKARLCILHHSSQLKGQNKHEARIFEFTPANLLAGITASLGLFLSSAKLSSKDTIGLEFEEEDVIWGSGSSIAVAGLYAGADVLLFNELEVLPQCQPTVLVLKAASIQKLADQLVRLSKMDILKKCAIGRRLYKVYNGMLGSPLPDTTQWVGPRLRAILTNDPISQSSATLIRAGFGVSLQRVYVHPVATGPLLASHQYDFQLSQPQRPSLNLMIQCGPPGVNVECKIVGVPEPSLINNDAWKGKLLVRGPSVGTELASADTTFTHTGQGSTDSQSITRPEDFYPVAEVAQVLPNGTFNVFSMTGDD